MTGSTDGIKGETFRFVAGEVLIILGGVLMGIGDTLGEWVPFLGPGLFAVGLFWAVMTFKKVSKSVSNAHTMLKDASIARQNDEKKIKESTSLLEGQSKDIKRLYSEMQRAERRINDVKREIDMQDKRFRDDFEKIFGHSSVFSKHNWTNPLEKSIESFERRLKALEDAAENERFRRSIWRQS